MRSTIGRARGFTLFELMVVIIIVVLIAGMAAGLIGVFFRGQGVRQGSMLVTQALAQAKQLAADKRRVYFVVFTNNSEGGSMTVYEDKGTPPNKVYDPGDLEVEGRSHLTPGAWFEKPAAGGWIGVEPSGYTRYGSGSDVAASQFEASLKGGSKDGDIILCDKDPKEGAARAYMCIDVDPAAGKVRRAHFLNPEP